MSDSNAQAGFIAPDPADLAPLFPGYDIQDLIATGGMGAVYRAVQKSLDRTVALKILPMEFSSDAAFCAGFEAEAKAMARLNHPNLIGVYDFGEVNGMLYIVMEYVPGKSIYHSAYGRTIDPKEVIRLVTGVCNGLAHAHDNGIIHRDIKPSNILLDLHAEPKIGDFGLASPMGRTIEEGEEIFGTPHYTAPEVVDSPRSVDYRADIFSVGILLHELLTSRLPANDPRSASVIARCDPKFDAIIRKATMPVPAARYSSAKEIANDLQAISATAIAKGVPIPTGRMAARGPVVAGHRPARVGRVYSRNAPTKSSGSGMIAFFIAAAAAAAVAYVIYLKTPPETVAEPSVNILPANSGNQEKDAGQGSDGIETHDSTFSTQPDGESPDDPMREDGTADGTDVEGRPDDGNTDANLPDPKIDVAAFLDRARTIMQDKAKFPIAAYKLGMKENFAGFETSLKREEFKYKTGTGPRAGVVGKAIDGWRADGGKVPDELDGPLSKFAELKQVRAEYELKERGVKDTFDQAISKLSLLYVVGLDKEIERRVADNDPGSVRLIEKQIAISKADPDYFRDVILELPDEDED